MWRTNRTPPGIDHLTWHPPEGSVWMALLRSTFDDPKAVAPSFEAPHYVLVLDVTGDEVVVIDPHPWRDQTYGMKRGAFESAWTAARGKAKPRWAGCLYRQGR
ncbi:MAG TPA: hypothetical protein VF316_22300 [Polyangiaceae bacterium]